MIAAIYTRVSTTKEIQKDSLATQESVLREFCIARGWQVHPYIYNETKSGTKENREETNRLLEDAKKGRFQVIVAKELSRLARNQEFSSKIIKDMKILGVHLVTLDGAIDTTLGSSDITGLFSWLYEFESSKLSQRIKGVFRQKQLNGEFLGSNAPYGYFIKNKTLVIRDDSTPDIVRQIFQMYQAGKSFDYIARFLFNDDVPTPSQVGNKNNATHYWYGSSVRKILENRNYTGDLSQGRETTIDVTLSRRKKIPVSDHVIIRGTHEAIISSEEFELVQGLINKRRKVAFNGSGNATRPHIIVHPFIELLECGECGRNYHFKSKSHKTYVCGLYNKKGLKACNPKIIYEDELMNIIKADLVKFSNAINRNNLYNVLKKKQANEFEKSKLRANAIEIQIKNINIKKIKAMDKVLDDIFTKAQYDVFINAQDYEINLLNHELAEIQRLSLTRPIEFNIDKVKAIVEEALSFKELSRATLNKFVDKIIVKEENKIEIVYKFSSTQNELNELLNDVSK